MSGSTAPEAGALKKEFTFRSAFTLAFIFISPIVALYGVFALVLMSAGPAGFWAFGVVLVGQLFVAAAFALLASKWPYEGSVYQWARRLVGGNYGWWTGWAYIWSLVIAVAGGAYFIGIFLPILLNIAPFDPTTHLLVAIGMVLLVTLLNAAGPRVLKVFAVASLIAEVVGSIGLGLYLIVNNRLQPISVLFDTAGADLGDGTYLWAGFFAAVAFVGWAFVGFESAGAIAEEVKDAKRNVPKAIVFALVAIGVVVMFSAMALILAIPDLKYAMSGESVDPAADIIINALGVEVVGPLFFMIILGFLASMMAAQTSASRVIWSYGRDGVLPGSGALAKLSGSNKYPIAAVLTAGAVSVAVLLLSSLSAEVYTTLVSFSTAGFFIAFSMPVLGLWIAMMRGKWQPGPISLKGWAKPIVTVAVIWALFETVNIVWPRNPQLEWFQNYAVLLALGGVAAVGLVIWSTVRSKIAQIKNDVPVGADD